MKLSSLPHQLDADAGTCLAVVETPKGSRNKFTYDERLGAFLLKALLPDGMSFPMEFGFVPSTLAEDGDPLDVMVLADEPCRPGTVLEVRLLGVIEAEDVKHGKTERNDRLLAAAAVSNLYAKVKTVEDLGEDFTRNLVQFWVNKDALEGKQFNCLGVAGQDKATERVKRTAGAARKKR